MSNKLLIKRAKKKGFAQGRKGYLVFTLESRKKLYVECTCHSGYEYTLRVDTSIDDEVLETFSQADLLDWLEKETRLTYLDFATLHKEYAHKAPFSNRVSWEESL